MLWHNYHKIVKNQTKTSEKFILSSYIPLAMANLSMKVDLLNESIFKPHISHALEYQVACNFCHRHALLSGRNYAAIQSCKAGGLQFQRLFFITGMHPNCRRLLPWTLNGKFNYTIIYGSSEINYDLLSQHMSLHTKTNQASAVMFYLDFKVKAPHPTTIC
jgi:hypothetical protein